MAELCCDAKTIIVEYQCDICNQGIVKLVDSSCEKQDDGEYHQLNTYVCPVCGESSTIEDIRYPYIKHIPIGSLRPLTEEERQ